MSDVYYTCEHCEQKVYCVDGNVPDCPRCKDIIKQMAESRKNKHQRNRRLPVRMTKDKPLSYTAYKALSPNSVSKEEHQRYVYLFDLQKEGVISDLELQIKYTLIKSVTIPEVSWYRGFKQSAVTYSPDFRYRYAGKVIVEEYKGTRVTKAKNIRPHWRGSRNSIKAWVEAYEPYLLSGKLFFCVVGYHKPHSIYYSFDPNGNIIDYDLANYIANEDAA